MERIAYLSPTTFISSSAKEVLFYDTESGKFVKHDKNEFVEDFVSILQNPNNVYMICEKDIPQNKSVQSLIQKLFSNFMIDFFEYEKAKPFVIPPFLKCHEKLWLEKYPEAIGFNLLTDMYIYVNGKCNKNCPNCDKMAFQMTHCMKDEGEISLSDIENIVNEIQSYRQPITIHLCGGDIGKYSSLHELSFLLESMGVRPQIHLSYLNWNTNICEQLKASNPTYVFSVEQPICKTSLSKVVERCRNDKDKIEFVVTSEDDINVAERIINKEHLQNVSIIPFYDEKNLVFFKKNVFLEEEDITVSHPSKQMIYRRMLFNVNNIGKIILRSNGRYFANLNKSALGKIGQRLASITETEWVNGESWRDTRQSKPCSTCLYQYLCPSPSNYEYVIKKNLCFNASNNEEG